MPRNAVMCYTTSLVFAARPRAQSSEHTYTHKDINNKNGADRISHMRVSASVTAEPRSRLVTENSIFKKRKIVTGCPGDMRDVRCV